MSKKSVMAAIGSGAVFVWAVAGFAAPVSTAITYQGQLKDNGAPVNGLIQMSFQLYDAGAAGVPIGAPIAFPTVEVVGGLFSVDLDFGATAFNGDERFLEVTVAGNVLSPRQRIAVAAYALHAMNGGGGNALDAADGSPTEAVFVDAEGEVGIGTTTPGAALHIVDATGLSLRINDDMFVDSGSGFVGIGRSNRLTGAEVFGIRRTGTGFGGMYIETSDAAGMPFYGYATNNGVRAYHYLDSTGGWRILVNNTDRLTITSTGDVGVGTTAPDTKFHALKGTAGTVAADANSVGVFENSTNAYVSILAPDASEKGVLFGEPSHSAAGGVLYNSAATPDGLQFRTNGNIVRMAIDAQGEVGIGTANPTAPLDVALGSKLLQIRLDGGLVPGINLTGTGGNLGIMRIRNKIEMWPNDAGTTAASIDIRNATGGVTINLDGGTGNASFTGNISFGSVTRQMLTLWGSVYGIGVQAFTEYFRSDGGFAWFNRGVHVEATNNAGAGGTTLMVLDSAGNLGIGTTSPLAKLDVNGRTRTDSLEIVGGADLAEAFDVRWHEGTEARRHEGPDQSRDSHGAAPPEGNGATRQLGYEVEPGTVVVIDPDHAGELMVSTSPYDARVAGIISGAKGLAPGMVLRGEGNSLADGKHLVAMTGRVWCKCDTTSGPIHPGDLLTTSATPGHAMRVAADAEVPRGAILGKAMTELNDGTGLVLVLVNLQ